MGPVDQAEGRRARDAAVAHRSKRRHHEVQDDPSLSDGEIATISAWVDAGAPMGNPADMPQPRQFSDLDSWFIGKPDIVVTMDKPYMLRKDGPDNIVDVLVDPGFTEDMYVMAIESKPADPKSFKVVHHFTTNLVEDPKKTRSASSSTNTLSARMAMFSAGRRATDQGRHEDQLQPAFEPARRRDTSVSQTWTQGLPQGTCAEARRVHAAHGRRVGSRHTLWPGIASRRLLPAVEARAAGVVPAAHAQSREGAVHRSDLSRPAP